jgi:threonine synthase
MHETYRLFCPGCGADQRPDAARCAACGGLLAVELTRLAGPGERHPFSGIPGLGAMWRSNPVLPIGDPACIVSLGEGGTPCVPAAHLGSEAGLSVWLKNEAANPTGSFKDRQVSMGISHALDTRSKSETGATSAEVAMSASTSRGQETARPAAMMQFYVVSSGNVAAAAAAYSAPARVKCWVIAPATAPAGKLLQVQLCGARVIRIRSSSQEQLFRLAEQAARELGWYPLSTAARSSPFNIVGARTIAGEIVEQMPPPDWVIAPVGGGGLLGSLWQGFKEAARLRSGMRMPRLAAVQPAGCAPFVEAVERGLSAPEALVRPWSQVSTIAGGLADDIPFDAHVALPAIRESDGTAVAVTDDEIRTAQRLLAQCEGLFIEPSGAVSVAGLLRLIDDRTIAARQTVCCLLTGSGLKDPASVGAVPEPPTIAADIEQLRAIAAGMAG